MAPTNSQPNEYQSQTSAAYKLIDIMPSIRDSRQHRKRKRSNEGEKEACPYEGCYVTSYSISRHMAHCPHRPQPKRSARLQQQSERNQEPEDTQANEDTFHTYVEFDPSNQEAMFPDTSGGDDGLIIQNAQTAFQNWQNTAEPHPYRAYTSFLYPTNAPQPQINNDTNEQGTDEQNNVHVGDQTDTQNVGLVGNFGVNLAQRHYNLRKGNWEDITKFQTNLMYSPELAFQAHLLAELADFRHVPLELYDRIMEIFFVHVINGNLNFNRNYFHAQRRTIIKTLTEAHGMTQFKSKIVPVTMHHGGTVGCMVFDFKSIMEYIYNSPRIVAPNNIAKGIDFWTGKVMEPSDCYGEIHTGAMWDCAQKRYIGDDERRFPMAGIVFGDETQTVRSDSMAVTSLFWCACVANQETRAKTYCWIPIGFIPNLKFGLSKEHKKTKEGLQDEHDCLYEIFRELIDIHNSELGGTWMTVLGEKVLAVPWVHYFITDMKGANRFCGAYNNNKGITQRPHRACKCPNLSDVKIKCDWVTAKELHAEIHRDMARCPDHDYYKSSPNKGATETVKQGATENIGNVLALILLSYSHSGQELFVRNGVGGGNKGADMMNPLLLFLTSLAWMHSNVKKEEINPSLKYLSIIMEDIKNAFERTEGQGWDVPKVHSYLQMPHYIRWYGNAVNYYGGFGERGHITWVKDNFENTRKQSDTFLQDLGKRCEEKIMIGVVQENLINQFPEQVQEMSNKSCLNKRKKEVEDILYGQNYVNSNSPTCFVNKHYGEYTINFDIQRVFWDLAEDLPNDETNCWFEREIIWTHNNYQKQKANKTISYDIQLSLAKLGLKSKQQKFSVKCYTMTNVQFSDIPGHTILRCTDSYKGKPWYDFVTVKVGSNEVAGKLLSIVKIAGKTWLLIHTEAITNTPSKASEKMLKDFVYKFSLGDFNCIRLVDVSCLKAPLIVFPDYGRNIKRDFIAVLPKRKWAMFFKNELRNSTCWPVNA
eukprot:scaffold523_cov39-Cyclotella_meneghiniana.AAC.2